MQGTTEHSGSPRVLLNLPLPNLPFLDMPFFFITSNQRWVGTSTHICMVSFKSSLKIMHNKDRLNSLQNVWRTFTKLTPAYLFSKCVWVGLDGHHWRKIFEPRNSETKVKMMRNRTLSHVSRVSSLAQLKVESHIL